jgi:hypothetical protein
MKTISPWVFAGLVIMNIALLVIIWMGHPRGGAPFITRRLELLKMDRAFNMYWSQN